MSARPRLPIFCVVAAGPLAGGCGGSQPQIAPPARAQAASAGQPDPQLQQALKEFDRAMPEATRPVPHHKDFKVPASGGGQDGSGPRQRGH
jgi:hypothetical protein